MTEKDESVANEFITTVNVGISNEQWYQLVRYLNLHYLGDVSANEFDENNFYVPKYPEKETKEYKDALWRAAAEQRHQVKVIFDVHGNCKLEVPGQ